MMTALLRFGRNLVNPTLAPTALRVALFIGTLLFLLNHGKALVMGSMSSDRWMAALITYVVPYCVNIHGQTAQLTRSTSSDRL